MPKLSKRFPKYRLHKASGQAVVTLSGRDHYLGPHDSSESRRKYERALAEWLAAGRVEAPQTASRVVLVEDLLAGFWAHAVQYYRQPDGQPTSEVDSFRQIMRLLRTLYSDLPADRFGPQQYKAIRDQLVRRGITRKSVEKRMGRVKRIFRWGVENGYCPAGVVQSLESVAGLKKGRCDASESAPVTPVEDAQIDTVLPYLTPPVAAMVRLQRLTGMRPGEVTRMRPGDLDRSNGKSWVYRPSQHKTQWRGGNREVYLGPKAQSVLQPFLDRADDAFCFSPAEAMETVGEERRTKRKTPLTPSQRSRKPLASPKRTPGKQYTVGSYGRAIANACKRAGISRWSPNQIRHRVATEVRAEHGLEAAQTVLGHQRADVTQIYAERDASQARRIAETAG